MGLSGAPPSNPALQLTALRAAAERDRYMDRISSAPRNYAAGPFVRLAQDLVPGAQARVEKYSGLKRFDAAQATHRFREYLHRLDGRLWDLAYADKALTVDGEDGEPDYLHRAQLTFVDRVEAFHQHVYAAMSSLILCASHILSPSETSQLPIRSVSRFLDRHGSGVFSHASSGLKASLAFRNRFIDHPQQHALHDWMTFKSPSGTVVVYFIPQYSHLDSDPTRPTAYYAIRAIDNLDPFSDDFRPPVDCTSFYVSPAYRHTTEAFCEFTRCYFTAIALRA